MAARQRTGRTAAGAALICGGTRPSALFSNFLRESFMAAVMADDVAAVAFGDDVFQFHTQPRYMTG